MSNCVPYNINMQQKMFDFMKDKGLFYRQAGIQNLILIIEHLNMTGTFSVNLHKKDHSIVGFMWKCSVCGCENGYRKDYLAFCENILFQLCVMESMICSNNFYKKTGYMLYNYNNEGFAAYNAINCLKLEDDIISQLKIKINENKMVVYSVCSKCKKIFLNPAGEEVIYHNINHVINYNKKHKIMCTSQKINENPCAENK